ncbi:MAG: M48 family metalloprotease [Elainellaceae cyanobacterium]
MNQVKTVGLLGLLSGLLVAISYWMIGGTGGALIGVVIAAVMNLGSWYYSDRIALSAYRAQPVEASEAPALYSMVRRLSDRAGLPMPAVYIIPTDSLNAFATGRDPEHAAVAVTKGLMAMLPEDELEGVVAHEMTHILNRDTLTQAVAATLGGAISFLAQMVSYSMWFGGTSRNNNNSANPLGLLLTVMLAPMAATVIQLGISRTREYSADAGAAELTGKPRALAQALQRLDQSARKVPIQANPAFEPLLIMNAMPKGGFNSLFSTHPSTEDRVNRLLQPEQSRDSAMAR